MAACREPSPPPRKRKGAHTEKKAAGEGGVDRALGAAAAAPRPAAADGRCRGARGCRDQQQRRHCRSATEHLGKSKGNRGCRDDKAARVGGRPSSSKAQLVWERWGEMGRDGEIWRAPRRRSW